MHTKQKQLLMVAGVKLGAATAGGRECLWAVGSNKPGGLGGSSAAFYLDNFRQVTGYFSSLDLHLFIYKMGITMPISSLHSGRLN